MNANRVTRAFAELTRRLIVRPVARRRPDFIIGPPADPYMGTSVATGWTYFAAMKRKSA